YVSSNVRPGMEQMMTFALPFLRKDYFLGEKYAPGEQVEVIYDPNRPRRSALECGDLVVPILGVIAGLVILIVSLFFRFGALEL
ncbi:MAG: DUF3592 domain-containing protein, partial [Amphiplicatus sp.]